MPVRFGEGLPRFAAQLGQHGKQSFAGPSSEDRLGRRAVAKESVGREINAPAYSMHRQRPHQPCQPIGEPCLEGHWFERWITRPEVLAAERRSFALEASHTVPIGQYVEAGGE